MDIGDIQKMVSEFEGKLKPVTAKDKAMAAGVEVEELKPVEAVPAAGGETAESCVTRDFKKLVSALPANYVGKGGPDVHDLVKEFLNSLPECEE